MERIRADDEGAQQIRRAYPPTVQSPPRMYLWKLSLRIRADESCAQAGARRKMMDTPTAISRLQQGDRSVPWAHLYETYHPEVLRFATWLLRDASAAADVTQELF